MLIQVMGLFGSLKEHFCLSCTYAVFSALDFAVGIFNSINAPVNWISTVISFVLTLTTIFYCIDLRKIALEQVENAN